MDESIEDSRNSEIKTIFKKLSSQVNSIEASLCNGNRLEGLTARMTGAGGLRASPAVSLSVRNKWKEKKSMVQR